MQKMTFFIKQLKKNYYVYLILLPVIVYYIVFNYGPMYGVIIAFKNFTPKGGIWNSQWVGFKHFMDFFNSYYFDRLLRNTLLINFYGLLFGFPAPIILALLLNEIKDGFFKRMAQTVSYLPHFISTVVICGMLVDFLARDGLISQLIASIGLAPPNAWLREASAFRTIFVGSGIWEGIGWGSIIYLAALSGVDQELYDASYIDGANRWHRMTSVTLPSILPTIVIMLILRLGSMMSVGTEKIVLLYNTTTYETSDVISSFVYRRGLLEADYSFSTAVGLFNSAINCLFLITANAISRKVNETSLW